MTLPLGEIIPPWGLVVAVGFVAGERYYWLEHDDGCVSMMPATVIDREREIEPPRAPADPTDD